MPGARLELAARSPEDFEAGPPVGACYTTGHHARNGSHLAIRAGSAKARNAPQNACAGGHQGDTLSKSGPAVLTLGVDLIGRFPAARSLAFGVQLKQSSRPQPTPSNLEVFRQTPDGYAITATRALVLEEILEQGPRASSTGTEPTRKSSFG
jgi:hypothetical protein